MSAFQIEEVRDIDAAWQDLTGMYRALYEHQYPAGEPPLTYDWQRQWRSHLAGGERLILLARDGNSAIGYFSSRIHRGAGLYSEAFGFVEEAYVLPEYRNRGIAREMLVRTEAWCRGRGIHLLRLSVLAGNTLALGFWEKSGFEPLMHILSKQLDEVPA
jgi:ribosomal protein S18 acetylase RimI-like enzyme